MGTVYRARDTVLDRTVALKVLTAGGDADSRRRLLHEARAASALNHPNSVTIHAVEEHEGVAFIVMEHVEGVPLDRYHWYRASGAFGVFSDILKFSNFGGRGPARVGVGQPRTVRHARPRRQREGVDDESEQRGQTFHPWQRLERGALCVPRRGCARSARTASWLWLSLHHAAEAACRRSRRADRDARPRSERAEGRERRGRLGAQLGLVFLAIEPRLRTSVLLSGGFDVPMFKMLGTRAEDKRHAVLEGGHLPPRPQEVFKEIWTGWTVISDRSRRPLAKGIPSSRHRCKRLPYSSLTSRS